MDKKPTRLQRRRTPGYNMQAESLTLNGLECVSVTRPGKWGNPHKVGALIGPFADGPRVTPQIAVERYRGWIVEQIVTGKLNIESLRGKNLACFCKLGEPCHADVLLEFANK